MNNKEIVLAINNFIGKLNFSNDKISEAIKYTIVNNEAKRIRPLLFLLTCNMFGNINDKSIKFATAIELIHNYSLVHDDLECMDNDDYRRGKLTVHKKYGEDIAVLVGDALLNTAFEILTDEIENKTDAKSANYIAKSSGCNGMIKGQLLDISDDISEENIIEIYDKKTCCLLKASTVSAGILCNADEFQIKKLEDYAFNLGMAFQIIDDLLDFDNDFKMGKKTYATIFGKEKSINDSKIYSTKAINCIRTFKKPDSLIELTNKLLKREH